MRVMSKAGPGSQRGASFFATLIILALLALIITAGLKLAPAYMDNGVVVNAMDGVIANNDVNEMRISEVREQVMRTLNVNNVNGFDPESIQFVEQGGVRQVEIDYESRVSLFYNIDAVVSFENSFDL